jgi:hypothetical protein
VRESIWFKSSDLGIAWPHGCHASGNSDREAGNLVFLRKLSRRPAIGTGVGEAARRIPVGGGLSEVICKIGKKAGVVVNKADGKFASAHDLRRAFGTRWAGKIRPATLMLLMRHADIATTMNYYVAQDSDDVADELWAGYKPATPVKNIENGNTMGNTQQYRATNSEPVNDISPCNAKAYESGQGRD